MGTEYGGWEVIKPLGAGGQSSVFVARSPERVAARLRSVGQVIRFTGMEVRAQAALEFANALAELSRNESGNEVGALKVFKMSDDTHSTDDAEALQRLTNEIAALTKPRPGLPRLLASNADQHWLVTELFERGTLEKNIGLFYAMPEKAVRAFRSLVAAVASLHADGYVHRDIKPPNIFVQHDDELVLGDFGIVYMPSLGERVTQTNERVGPRDYMPQWADLGERQESVLPNFDVYMLGKVLWCMISGRLKLPREYHRRTEYDLTVKFPNDPRMHLINLLLDACVVEEPAKCLKSAVDLLQKVDECISLLSRNLGIFVSDGKVLMPCRMCGKGTYKQEMPGAAIVVDSHDDSNRHLGNARLRPFICTVCTHREFFSPNFPEEAHRKGWKPW